MRQRDERATMGLTRGVRYGFWIQPVWYEGHFDGYDFECDRPDFVILSNPTWQFYSDDGETHTPVKYHAPWIQLRISAITEFLPLD